MEDDGEEVRDAIDCLVISRVKETIRSIDAIGYDPTDMEEFKRHFRGGSFQTYLQAVNDVSRSISEKLNIPNITYDFNAVTDIIHRIYSTDGGGKCQTTDLLLFFRE